MLDGYEAELERWREAMKAKGHSPVVDEDGRLNVWVTDSDFHNGPGCSVCGWTRCMHCITEDDIPFCTANIIEGELAHPKLEDKT